MQINLKQTEIEAALKGYIAKQGINLKDKEVSISFTAGRKESGISAEVTIEEAQATSSTFPLGPEIYIQVEEVEETAETVEATEADEENVVADLVAPPAEPAKTVSLFG